MAAYNGEEAAAKSYDAKLDLPQKVSRGCEWDGLVVGRMPAESLSCQADPEQMRRQRSKTVCRAWAHNRKASMHVQHRRCFP